MKSEKIDVKGTEVTIFQKEKNDYLSLTDIARYKNPREPKDVIKNWMRSKNTIEFLGLWEILNNPKFKGVEFDHFKSELIKEGLDADTRLKRLNQIAFRQMKIMIENKSLKKLEGNR